ncbi:MAG: Crp/Fnr family transcriptional regulator [Hydrogenobacter thermophilus]|uniref:Transcriptional regulator, Crp/Fnr family n=1 Tax=Hydrogenobacter thermophilus (strain DSM 6534 / IAM 12695 / TK-6) TaxID=608538 RepID=D3DK58_HYDTT|nr:Crp/Fnr family transcriptional regulator [Hydrogenobacter thermophilus]ADO46129.1 transcriptional regulator, Crp/Fnr family [Hydrogenobacter thermophilus TK-6]QWK19266.1 MAG: Crp/Fnr family transcriptional regulator [Hydrogenobacter thermophilus]BAI70210.1 transcriptional regulator, Crp/Fnr family [Hydrogenobacter thermophilus TK-6]
MAKEALREREDMHLKLEMLKNVHMFEGLGEEELKEAVKYMQLREFRRNEYIFFEEEAEPGIYILIDGLIKLLKETQDARIVIVRLVYPGDVFGWIEWGKKAPKNTYTAKSMTESKTLYISNKDFINLAIKHPAIAIKMTCEATANLIQTYETLKSIAGGKVEERIAKVILEIADRIGKKYEDTIIIEAPLTRLDIAEMTGTTVETTIRVMSKWKKQGIINTERGYIEILKRRELEKLVI